MTPEAVQPIRALVVVQTTGRLFSGSAQHSRASSR